MILSALISHGGSRPGVEEDGWATGEWTILAGIIAPRLFTPYSGCYPVARSDWVSHDTIQLGLLLSGLIIFLI